MTNDLRQALQESIASRSAAFTLARQRVRETGKPWLVVLCENTYFAHSAYDELSRRSRRVAWISVNGSERVYDGLEAPAAEETR